MLFIIFPPSWRMKSLIYLINLSEIHLFTLILQINKVNFRSTLIFNTLHGNVINY